MTIARRAGAVLGRGALYLVGMALFAAVFLVVFGALRFVLGAVADGLMFGPEGFAGGGLHYGIPGIAAVASGLRLGVKRIFPYLDRLERWSAA